jgi:hypothetical protein
MLARVFFACYGVGKGKLSTIFSIEVGAYINSLIVASSSLAAAYSSSPSSVGWANAYV